MMYSLAARGGVLAGVGRPRPELLLAGTLFGRLSLVEIGAHAQLQ